MKKKIITSYYIFTEGLYDKNYSHTIPNISSKEILDKNLISNTDNGSKTDSFLYYHNIWVSKFPILDEMMYETDLNKGKYVWTYSKDFSNSTYEEGSIFLEISSMDLLLWDIEFYIHSEIESEMWMSIKGRKDEEEIKIVKKLNRKNIDLNELEKSLNQVTKDISEVYNEFE